MASQLKETMDTAEAARRAIRSVPGMAPVFMLRRQKGSQDGSCDAARAHQVHPAALFMAEGSPEDPVFSTAL